MSHQRKRSWADSQQPGLSASTTSLVGSPFMNWNVWREGNASGSSLKPSLPEQTQCQISEASEPARKRPRKDQIDFSSDKILVIGDSFLQGLEKILHKTCRNPNWRVDCYDGHEALGMKVAQKDVSSYDHIFYCSAGNCIWKGGKTWKDVMSTVSSFSPENISGVVLFGTEVFWIRLAPAFKAKQPCFFEDVRKLLYQREINVVQMKSAERLELSDKEGHPTKQARWELVTCLLDAFKSLVMGEGN